jgi:hypothetical protein
MLGSWLLVICSKAHLAVGGEVVGVSRLFSPRTLDGVPVDVGVVDGHDGVSGRLLRRKSDDEE